MSGGVEVWVAWECGSLMSCGAVAVLNFNRRISQVFDGNTLIP